MRFVRNNAVAVVALMFAMSGGALAAKHYVISSTKQISPKVLKRLKGKAGPKGTTGPAGQPGKEGSQGKEGPQGAPGGGFVVARVRGAGLTETTSTGHNYSLTGATWSQGSTEAEQFVGNVSLAMPPESKCNFEPGLAGAVFVEILVDGNEVARTGRYDEPAEQKGLTIPVSFESGLVDNGAPQAHTMTVKISDDCGGGGGSTERRFTIESVNVDVIGAR